MKVIALFQAFSSAMFHIYGASRGLSASAELLVNSWAPNHNPWNDRSYRRQIVYTCRPYYVGSLVMTTCPEYAWLESRDLFEFPDINNYISKMVQDRDIVTMEN